MKTNDKKEVRTKTVAEIKKLLKEAHDAVRKFKLDHQQIKLTNTRSIFNKRQEVAVLSTILKEKEAVKNG
jgi:ribosomal protein L29